MCNDDHLSRRDVLRGAAVLGAGAALADRRRPAAAARRVTRASRASLAGSGYDGTSPYSMAMHVHSSFSEQTGSMMAQLAQAEQNGVDVLWWTDHDARMAAVGYSPGFSFTSFSEPSAPGGAPWKWTAVHSGTAKTAPVAGCVTSPVSPNDPDGGSLELQVQAKGTVHPCVTGYAPDCSNANYDFRGSLQGETVAVDVLLAPGWSRGCLQFTVTSSWHPADDGRPAGQYSVAYQFVPGSGPRTSAMAAPDAAVITVPMAADGATWVTQQLVPGGDIAALWPDLDSRDFGLCGFEFAAVSDGDLVRGWFANLAFTRAVSGGEMYSAQADMMAALAPAYSPVTQYQALEVSLTLPHVNWFGNVTFPAYGEMTAAQWLAWVLGTGIPAVHQAGGLCSWNHPYGTLVPPLKSASAQAAAVTSTAKAVLPSASMPAPFGGADILEVGYGDRAGMGLAAHTALWDIASRNAFFMTGNGTNDDHDGVDWLNGNSVPANNFFTSTWAASSGESDLLDALAAGRAFAWSMSGYGGVLDLLADGMVPMGAASVSALPSRSLTITATGVPAGGSVRLLQGAVDYAWKTRGGLSSNASPVAVFTAADMAAGTVTVPVDTAADSYLRTQVLDGSGNVVALSNPVWLLQNAPPNGIPAPRQA